jgi:bifunctional DNA-binding transcriptional regulator/antitoxin component of YhaV-PrlF toxin-antitoxin module
MQVTVEVDRNGRILVPAKFRKAYHWNTGVKLTLKATSKGVVLSTKKDKINNTVNEMRDKVANLGSLDEFLKFRKEDQK